MNKAMDGLVDLTIRVSMAQDEKKRQALDAEQQRASNGQFGSGGGGGASGSKSTAQPEETKKSVGNVQSGATAAKPVAKAAPSKDLSKGDNPTMAKLRSEFTAAKAKEKSALADVEAGKISKEEYTAIKRAASAASNEFNTYAMSPANVRS